MIQSILVLFFSLLSVVWCLTWVDSVNSKNDVPINLKGKRKRSKIIVISLFAYCAIIFIAGSQGYILSLTVLQSISLFLTFWVLYWTMWDLLYNKHMNRPFNDISNDGKNFATAKSDSLFYRFGKYGGTVQFIVKVLLIIIGIYSIIIHG